MTPWANRSRRRWIMVVLAVVGWSLSRAGLDPTELINASGWSQFTDFFAAMFHPDLSGEFIDVTARATATTLAYAILGTAMALMAGITLGPLISERFWRPLAGPVSNRRGTVHRLVRALVAIPRGVHEIVFGLILINVLGLNPLVAVLAIGIPFGATTAKVFADLIDEVPDGPELAMRSAGAGRLAAMIFAVIPTASGDLLSYGFYRLECSIRSAAVLGMVGAGGLGFQLALSFQSLRYDQMWTLLWALTALSAIADSWSGAVRRRRGGVNLDVDAVEGAIHSPRRDRLLTASAALCTLMVPISWIHLDLSLSSLWSQRTRNLAADLVNESFPPHLGPDGWNGLLADSADTVALAVLALAMAGTISAFVAFVAARRPGRINGPADAALRACGALLRIILLIARSVPPPVWALLTVFVFLPGLWPGAIALAVYQLGVLGRLQSEVVENHERRPGEVLEAAGASAGAVVLHATIPAVATRFVALGLYRWEVTVRDTVMVGVVGAAGLGRLISEQTSSFDHAGALSTVLTLIVISVAADQASAAIRRSLR